MDRLRRAIAGVNRSSSMADFDVDGVTATVLLVRLEALGAKVKPYIPHRIDEGYGLNLEALTQPQTQGVRIVVTVDCGVRSLEEISFGKSIGLDMIVTDHHAPGTSLPDAYAIVNPKQRCVGIRPKSFRAQGLPTS